jgi:hypothetical protein
MYSSPTGLRRIGSFWFNYCHRASPCQDSGAEQGVNDMTTTRRQAPAALPFDDLLDEFYSARNEYVTAAGLDTRALDERDDPLDLSGQLGPPEIEAKAQAVVDIVNALVPYPESEASLDELVVVADGLREDAALSGHERFNTLADLIAPPPDCPRAVRRFDEAFLAFAPEAALRGVEPPARARDELRAAAEAVLASQPRCPHEIGLKTKVAAIVGAFAVAKRACTRPDPYAARMYSTRWRELRSAPPWFFADAVGCRRAPADIEACRASGAFVADVALIDEMIDSAGATWRRQLARDVDALRASRAFP